MNPTLMLGSRPVGLDHQTYFVADVAANHDGDLDRALALIDLAAEAGADAAKFQNFTAETIVSGRGFDDLGSQLSHQEKWTKSVVEVYRDATLPLEWTTMLRDRCDSAGIGYLTAPYDLSLVGELSEHVIAWKLGSGDITWSASIDTMASTGKPILIATGASDMDDVARAMDVARRHTDRIVLMQCNTNYTGSLENFRHIELRVLKTFQHDYPDVVLGLSDHTPGHATVLGAVTLGARVIEKHFTDDQARPGPDHPFSMNPVEWRDMVGRTRELELALGTGTKRVMDNERETVVVQRRSIRATMPLTAGVVLEERHLTVLRPCPTDGLPPYRMGDVVGRTLARSVDEGEHLRLTDLA